VVGDFAQDAGLLSPPFDRQAVLWQAGARQDLGMLPGHTSSQARGINGVGHVVGWSGTTEGAESHAVLWINGEPQDLGTLRGDVSSQALAVNAAGQVVGWSGSRAFVWQGGAMTDLNSLMPAGSGWVLTRATAINDAGQIAGTGLLDGQVRAFLLTPDALLLTVDIRPGTSDNSVNPKSHGKISVAILSTASFDAGATVDQLSLTFGPTGDEPSWDVCDAATVDVNGDGLPDLLCHFSTAVAAFQPGDTTGILRGRTLGGMPFLGSDTVSIVPTNTSSSRGLGSRR
jgi:probable HAF family extracellular repeat protein